MPPAAHPPASHPTEIVQAGPVARLIASGVIPVVQLPSADLALPLADALAAGGIAAIEITLRSEAGLAGMAAAAAHRPAMLTIAGTVLTPAQMRAVADAGAAMAVSPGFSERAAEAANALGLPWLPGVATASDCMRAIDAGLDFVKFFPAEQAGGPAMLKALSGPFPQLAFCPTGGVTEVSMAAYVATGKVRAVGGSWIAPTPLIAAREWAEITRRAAAAKAAFEALRQG